MAGKEVLHGGRGMKLDYINWNREQQWNYGEII